MRFSREKREKKTLEGGIDTEIVPDPGVWFIRIDSGHLTSSRMYSCGGGSFPPPPAKGEEGGEADVTWTRQKLVGSSGLRPSLSSISRITQVAVSLTDSFQRLVRHVAAQTLTVNLQMNETDKRLNE